MPQTLEAPMQHIPQMAVGVRGVEDKGEINIDRRPLNFGGGVWKCRPDEVREIPRDRMEGVL
jgi:hypothetical protein